jgi:hypothetical protein
VLSIFASLLSKHMLRPWPVATAPGSDFASNRLKFESNYRYFVPVSSLISARAMRD